jgi:hypothetical protein
VEDVKNIKGVIQEYYQDEEFQDFYD